MIFAAVPAFSQGSIRGAVKDAQGAALPGVTVTATSPAAAIPHTAVTDAEGVYRLADLPAGDYVETAELPNFSKFVREGVVVRTGLNLTIDIVLQIGSITEAVEVKGDTPMLETKKAVTAVNVSGELQRSVPLSVRKHWSEFMRLAPGSVNADSISDNAPIFYIRGAGIVSYSTLVDGAEISSNSNPWWGFSNVSDLSIGDVQIQTGGMDAAAPLGMGAAANVALKSGTNRLSGAAEFSYTPKEWVGNNVPGATPTSLAITQPDFSLGGPIERDHAWFYGSYRHRDDSLGISRTAQQIADLTAIAPLFGLSFSPFANEATGHIVYVKLTGKLNSNHTVSGFYNYDRSPYYSEDSISLDKNFRVKIGGSAASSRVSSAWNSWLTSQLTFSWTNKTFDATFDRTDNPTISVFQTAFPSEGVLQGGTELAHNNYGFYGGYAQYAPANKWTIAGEMTAYRTGWLGSHELRLGGQLQPRMRLKTQVNYLAGGQAVDEYVLRDPNDSAAGVIPFHRRIYDTDGGLLGNILFSDDALYVQDTWSVNSRVSLNLGVRIDRVSRDDQLFGQRIQDSWDAGPRLGANFILTSDLRNVLRASYMRIHEAANVNNWGTLGTVSFGYRDEYSTNLDGVFDKVIVVPPSQNLSESRQIDPTYHQPYVDEYSIGYRRQLPRQTTADIGYVHRTYKDRPALVETNGIYEDGVFKGYRDERQNEIYLLTSNIWNQPIYRAIEFIVVKRTDNVEFLGNYTRVFPHLAGTWQPNDPASFIQPDAFPIDHGLLTNDNRFASQNNGYCTGSLFSCTGSPEFTEHVVHLSARYTAPWHLIMATNYTMQYGLWSSGILTKIAAPDPRFGPPTVTLSNGRVVTNPLSTTYRFAYATRDEGQLRLPALHVWNVRFGRKFALGRTRQFESYLDVYNVANRSGFSRWQTGANQQFDTRNFGMGSVVQIPRTFQLGLQFSF